MKYLKLCGYKSSSVTKAFSETRSKNRDETRLVKDQRSATQLVIFSTKFNPRDPNVKSIVDRHLPAILNAPTLKNLFPDGSIMIANKQ